MTAEFDPIAAIENRLANKTEAELDRERKYQEEQRQRLSVMDTRSSHAQRAIDIALHNLESNPDDDFEYTRLAEGYYLLGDFKKAFETTRNEEKKAEYEAFMNAKPYPCECPKTKTMGKVRPDSELTAISISPRFVKEKFPGKDLIYCTTCHQYYVKATG